MKLTNDRYVILIGTKHFTERYGRDETGWFKISARGRTFRMTAEQVLNHLLPALVGIKRNLVVEVRHQEPIRSNQDPIEPAEDERHTGERVLPVKNEHCAA